MNDIELLKLAVEKANESVQQGGFPAGAIVAKDDKVMGQGISIGNKLHDPTSHGEIAAIRDACQTIQTSELLGATLYTSLEPCMMCLSAAMWSSISRIVYACPKEMVSNEYYGGHYHCSEINMTFNRPIELIHAPTLEKESLAIVNRWELINS